MKISNARTIVTCPGRNFVTVKLETDEGVYGIGDATLNGPELAVASLLDEHVLAGIPGLASTYDVSKDRMNYEPADEVFPHAYSFEDGYLQPGEAIGHGVDIDEELAAKYPYKRAYLPVNRLTDGTLSNW